MTSLAQWLALWLMMASSRHLAEGFSQEPISPRREFISTRKSPLLLAQSVIFQYSSTSSKHLENTELPDDYNRPWTSTKIKAFAIAITIGSILGMGGEVLMQNLFDIEKSFVLFAAVGTGGGWFLGGGQQVAEDERPINGGYDRKLIADRPSRMTAILEFLRSNDQVVAEDEASVDVEVAMKYISQIHHSDYLRSLQVKCQDADRPQRFNPVYSRTLIDQHSYQAAINAVRDWMTCVDAAIDDTSPPKFALVRPPSHHATKSKAMGGCLLNSVAAAALYALDLPGIKSVAILDIDAHHGNGIAHCVQENSKICYVSIHEDNSSGYLQRQRDDASDPRSGSEDDHGPLGNILNVNVPAGTAWDSGYRYALESRALPFIKERGPDLVLVAAGFDALDSDLTSKIKLMPRDYFEIGSILKEEFGSHLAFGLEGGYCWQDESLQQAITSLVEPWQRGVSNG